MDEQDGSLIGMDAFEQPDALDNIDRRCWQKRKDVSGLDAAAKRQMLVAPAGQKTAAGGIILPRNNEVFEAPLSTPSLSLTLSVPDELTLVATAAAAHTKGAQTVVCSVDCLELHEGGAAVAGCCSNERGPAIAR